MLQALRRLWEHPLFSLQEDLYIISLTSCQVSAITTQLIPSLLACGKFCTVQHDWSSLVIRWMTIPHVATVSSLLLAGNNPLILQSATNTPTIRHPSLFRILAPAYDSRYQTEWMYFRGRSKYLWFQRTLGSLPPTKPSTQALKCTTTFQLQDWATIVFLTQTVLFVPFFLAFLTSYFTPQVGLSCRSLTFLIYYLTQTLQVGLWIWLMLGCAVEPGGTMHSPAHHTKPTLANHLRCLLFWALACLFGITSIFAAIGGTIMQLLGVYSNCLCALPVWYWLDRERADGIARISLGVNSGEDILAAKTWWVGTGSTAIAFLCLTSGWGWWYQRRLRGLFKDIAVRL